MKLLNLLQIVLATALLTSSIQVLADDALIIEVIYVPNDCPIKSRTGDLLTTDYTAYWANGTAFETTEGDEPFQFTIGVGQVIKGWDLGLLDMCVTEKRKLTIPPQFAYGENGSSDGFIPPNTTLLFDVTLLAIDRQ